MADEAWLASEVVRLRRRTDILERAAQIAHSTVEVPDGADGIVDMAVPTAVGRGVQAGFDAKAVNEALAVAKDELEAAQAVLDDKLAGLDVDLGAATGRLDAAESQLTDAFGRITTVEGVADSAVSAASDAQSAADTAVSDAATAIGEAEAAAQAAAAAQTDATAAVGAAGDAEAAADAAATQAATALSEAQAASGDATAAQTAADAAQDAADQAATDASTAGTAAAAADAKAAQAAADAAQAIADAAQAAEDASDAHDLAGSAASNAAAAMTTASGAQTTADDASDLAVAAAQSAQGASATADAAQSTADNLPKILHGINTAPAGTAPDGSIWWNHKDALTGPVRAQWTRTGGSWVETPIDSDAVANLDVGKLTVGGAVIAELVAQAIASATAEFQRADIKNLFVTAGATINEAVIDKLWADVVVARIQYSEKVITSEAIVDELVGKIITAVTINGGTINGVDFVGGRFSTTGTTSPQDAPGVWVTQDDGVVIGSGGNGNTVHLYNGYFIGEYNGFLNSGSGDKSYATTQLGNGTLRIRSGLLDDNGNREDDTNDSQAITEIFQGYISASHGTVGDPWIQQDFGIGAGGVSFHGDAGGHVSAENGPLELRGRVAGINMIAAEYDPQYAGPRYPILIHGETVRIESSVSSSEFSHIELDSAGNAQVYSGNGRIDLNAGNGVYVNGTRIDRGEWIDLDFTGTNYTHASFGLPCQVALISGKIELRGVAQRTSGNITGGEQIGMIPTDLLPGESVYSRQVGGGNSTVSIQISPSTGVRVKAQATPTESTSWVALDSIYWFPKTG